ncbi:MAG: DUF1343 domain-containing protein [Ignavibacteriae bacterium]|nr:DUF1343 domain-containing protein [Ignavibacteriota bacterium]
MRINFRNLFALVIISAFVWTCASEIPQKESVENTDHKINADTRKNKIQIKENVTDKKILLGIDVLAEDNFEILKNKRVGIITNQTGVNRDLKSTIDILFESKNVKLVALFSPEHGIRGEIEGGENIGNNIDALTKLPVYSLYGKTQKPTKKMLSDIDVLIYDIQDIGVRSYTFISTLGLAMEAASENKIEFIVLDRPNPLGGLKIEGNIIEDNFKSFISQYPIPYIYGLTCGELAKLLVNEKMIKTNSDFKLNVIAMKNWNRGMTFKDTNLKWVPTSPHIPNFETTFYYPMIGILGELRSAVSIGVGYTLPFQIVGAEWINSFKLSFELNNQNLPGLFFRPISFKPFYGFGKGQTLNGVQIYITNYDKVNLTAVQFFIISSLQKLYPEKDLFKLSDQNEIKMFNTAIGTDKISNMIKNRKDIKEILDFLNKDEEKFRKTSAKYYIYF